MKKILSLLALVLLSCMGAWAQTANYAGTWYLQEVSTGKFAKQGPNVSGWQSELSIKDDGTAFQISSTEGGYYITTGRSGSKANFGCQMTQNGDYEKMFDDIDFTGKPYTIEKVSGGVVFSVNVNGTTRYMTIATDKGNALSLRTSRENAAVFKLLSSNAYTLVGRGAEVYMDYDDVSAWYKLTIGSTKKKLSHHADQTAVPLSTASIPDGEDSNYAWGFLSTATGVKIVNNAAGKGYVLASPTGAYNDGDTGANTHPVMKEETSLSGEVSEYAIDNSTSISGENGFYIKMHDADGNDYSMNDRNEKLAYWTGGRGAGSTFLVERIYLTEVYEVTYHVTNAYGETFDVVVPNVEPGATAEAPELEYFSNAVIAGDNHTVAADNKEFTVTGNWSFPFQEGKFYQIKNYNQQYLKNVDASNISTKNPANNNAAEMLWYFKHVANTQNQYTIHSVSNETAWNGTSGKMALAAEGTPFQILKQGSNFNIFSGNPNGYVGAHSDYNGANGAVGYWSGGSATEPGSQWTVLEFDESTLTALNLTNGDDGYVGTFKGDISGALTAANAYMSSKTAANLKAALEACGGEVERITIDPNKFYQLISQDGNSNRGRVVFSPAYCGTDGTGSSYGDRNIKLGTVGGAATTCTSALRFIPNGEGYTIQHVNSNYYFVRLSAFGNLGNPDLPISSGSAGKYLLHNVTGQPSDIWVLNNADATNKYLHCGYEGDNVNTLVIETNTPDTNNGLRWKIKEITEVPVTIGSVGYTTVCFPMAVTIPDGVTAYKVAEDTGDKMMLEEVTGNVAAQTPLILEKNGGGNVVFPVAATGEDLSATNELKGSTARRVGFAADSFYALAADNSATIGVSFKINGSVNAVPANKAYLPVSAGSSNKALYFDFGGTTTGIDAAETLPATDALYNLNGQRVVAPTRGIYVKANGQKVFIK